MMILGSGGWAGRFSSAGCTLGHVIDRTRRTVVREKDGVALAIISISIRTSQVAHTDPNLVSVFSEKAESAPPWTSMYLRCPPSSTESPRIQQDLGIGTISAKSTKL